MLQAHSFLWHYLWLAPHILQLALAIFICSLRVHRLFPIFVAYLLFEAAEEFFLYALDILPAVSADIFWRAFVAGLVIEGCFKLAVIGELFFNLLRPWPVIAKIGGRLISGAGAILVLLATLAAALVSPDSSYRIVSTSHILQQTFYIVNCGLLVFVFFFAAYFNLAWERRAFGIAMGFSILACEHLVSWAVMANGGLLERRSIVDLTNLATYHICVLIWIYYLVVPVRVPQSAVSLPVHSLDVWNRELERLLQP